ncbi:hypothetical protein INT45_014323 [Circinella minor]|uniref:Uncharacterized protein n=1 Tax=Circinella minor TaxID=1195481 RepID=A0A8H7RTF4_9FUNG|nr:hypothetical protein INT45_014323 [Circinella minor]
MSQAPVIDLSFKDVDLPCPSVPAPLPQTLEYSRLCHASMTPGPTKLLSCKRQLEQQRQSARKRASADRMKKTAETRDKSANKYFMKISALVGDEKLERYLKLLENYDIAMEKIQYMRSILNVETEYGECWKAVPYLLCADEGRTLLILKARAMLHINGVVQDALKKECPRFLADNGPKFRAFRWVGCPLLLNGGLPGFQERGLETDDDDLVLNGALSRKKNVMQKEEWGPWIHKRASNELL